MRFQAPFFAAVLAFGLILTGCSTARTLEGTWVSEGVAPTTVTVTGDSFKQTGNVMGSAFTVTGKGAYDDKAGTLTITDLNLDIPGAAPMIISAAAAKLPKQSTINVSWKNGDEIVLTNSDPNQIGGSGSFKRQKQ